MDSLLWIIGAFIVGSWFGYLICAILTIGKKGYIDDDY